MKNLRVLAYDATLFDKEPQLMRTQRNHGATQHFKGPWDSEFGVNTSVMESYYKTLSNSMVEHVSEVVEVMTKWASEQHRIHPTGPVDHFEEFLPAPKSTYTCMALANKYIGGVTSSCCFRFGKNDYQRKSIRGKALARFSATGINVRNHGLTDMKACRDECLTFSALFSIMLRW
jgi:hypothetical protein